MRKLSVPFLLLFATLFAQAQISDTVLYNFSGGTTDGAPTTSPMLLRSADTIFYGLTPGNVNSDKGHVFSFNPSTQAFSIIYSIPCCSTGTPMDSPTGQPAYDNTSNNLYFESAGSVGTGECCGAISKLTFNKTLGTWSLAWSHTCTNTPTDCYHPQAGLTWDQTNNIGYGVSQYGGANSQGTLFKITMTGALTLLHSFSSATDGQQPIGGVAIASLTDFDGRAQTHIFGTTSTGGSSNLGTLWEYIVAVPGRPAVFRVIHAFTGGASDGATPMGTPYFADTGLGLIGTTFAGGAGGRGTIYQLSASGSSLTYTLTHSFGVPSCVSDGCDPQGHLTADSSGNLYLSTNQGGSNQSGQGGTVIKLVPSSGNWTVSILHDFGASGDGTHPNFGVSLNGSSLYGTTSAGGTNGQGAIFSMATQ